MKHSIMIAVCAAGLALGQEPDNTKTNKRDRNDNAPTADSQQKMSKADTALAKQIRQALTADKSLSTYAHNVKILVQDGKVTLRGPVRSETERHEIQRKAASVAGADRVTNQLEVVAGKSN